MKRSRKRPKGFNSTFCMYYCYSTALNNFSSHIKDIYSIVSGMMQAA